LPRQSAAQARPNTYQIQRKICGHLFVKGDGILTAGSGLVDGDNRRRELRLDARNRREAALMLAELEQRSRRQRQAFEPMVSRDDKRTV
jgi:hypothetical protein